MTLKSEPYGKFIRNSINKTSIKQVLSCLWPQPANFGMSKKIL